jgi:hypothetical protein
MVIARAAAALGKDTWDVFIDLDSCFEEIAAAGSDASSGAVEPRGHALHASSNSTPSSASSPPGP